jgi:hypothetical protein
MQTIRVVTAGAVFLLASGIVAGGAAAQTASNATPGPPLQLLKIDRQPGKTTAKPYAKLLAHAAHKRIAHSIVAEAKPLQRPAPTAAAPAPAPAAESIWPIPSTLVAATDLAQPPASTPDDLHVGQLVVGGQMVKVAAPDDVNEIDLAANDTAGPDSAPAPSEAASSEATPTKSPPSDITPAQPKSDSMALASMLPQGGEIGSASWIMKVLAALGGAVAAGGAAWFMMGSAPQRTYG